MKYLFLALFLVLATALEIEAQQITIPGSQFPVVATPSNNMRFMMVYTNGGLDPNPLKGSNATITFQNLQSTIATYTINSIGSPNNVLLLGAKGGTNDDTAVLQSLFNQGGQYYFPPTNYTVGALYVTNNLQLLGSGGSFLQLKPGVTNAAILNWVPGVTNVIVQNMGFDGGYYADTSVYGTWNSTSNRMGLNVYLESDGTVVDGVTCRGFDKGISIFGDKNVLQTPASPRFKLGRVTCETNFYGIFAKSVDDNHVVEYFTPLQIDLVGNVIGYYMGGANQGIMYANITFNFIGIQADGENPNQLHGFIMGNKINHNSTCIEVCNLTRAIPDTIRIAGNEILAPANIGILVSNACGVVIENNNMGASPIWVGANGVSGSSIGPNWVVNNHYSGTWGPIGGIGKFYLLDWINGGTTDQTTNLVHWGNWSYNVLGNHDPYLFDPNQTNQAPVTFSNLTALSSFTIGVGDNANTNLVGVQTNGSQFYIGIGSGLTYNATTKTLSATGGAGTGNLSTNGAGNLTITGGVTNLFLFPSSLVKSGPNTNLTSVSNGAGSLTNDGSGNIGFSLKLPPGTDAGTATNFLNLAKLFAGANIALTPAKDTITGATNWTIAVSDPASLNQINAGTLWATNSVSPTNNMGGTAIDFSKSEYTTNLAGPLTLTSVINLTSGAYNRVLIHALNTLGSDQTVTLATGWGVGINDTFSITNNAKMDIWAECQPGVFTNVFQKQIKVH